MRTGDRPSVGPCTSRGRRSGVPAVKLKTNHAVRRIRTQSKNTSPFAYAQDDVFFRYGTDSPDCVIMCRYAPLRCRGRMAERHPYGVDGIRWLTDKRAVGTTAPTRGAEVDGPVARTLAGFYGCGALPPSLLRRQPSLQKGARGVGRIDKKSTEMFFRFFQNLWQSAIFCDRLNMIITITNSLEDVWNIRKSV